MKHSRLFLTVLALPALLLGSACRKNSTAAGGCITRYQPDIKERKLPVSQYDSAKQFFEANGLSLDTLQPLGFYFSLLDTLGRPFYQVPTRKFINGLTVENARLLYDFSAGVLSYSESEGYDAPLETSDTVPHLTIDQLRSIFLASNPDSYANGFGLNAVPHHPTHWADSCIYAMLEYTEKSLFDPCCGTQNTHLLIKAWRIQRSPDSGALAWIKDETGQIVPQIVYTAN